MTSRNRTIDATITTSWSVRWVPVEYLLTMIASVSGAVSDTTASTARRVLDRRVLASEERSENFRTAGCSAAAPNSR